MRCVGVARCEAVNERIEFLDMGEAAGEFPELALQVVDVEEMATVGRFSIFVISPRPLANLT